MTVVIETIRRGVLAETTGVAAEIVDMIVTVAIAIGMIEIGVVVVTMTGTTVTTGGMITIPIGT